MKSTMPVFVCTHEPPKCVVEQCFISERRVPRLRVPNGQGCLMNQPVRAADMRRSNNFISLLIGICELKITEGKFTDSKKND
jgi:hypothetical protein